MPDGYTLDPWARDHVQRAGGDPSRYYTLGGMLMAKPQAGGPPPQAEARPASAPTAPQAPQPANPAPTPPGFPPTEHSLDPHLREVMMKNIKQAQQGVSHPGGPFGTVLADPGELGRSQALAREHVGNLIAQLTAADNMGGQSALHNAQAEQHLAEADRTRKMSTPAFLAGALGAQGASPDQVAAAQADLARMSGAVPPLTPGQGKWGFLPPTMYPNEMVHAANARGMFSNGLDSPEATALGDYLAAHVPSDQMDKALSQYGHPGGLTEVIRDTEDMIGLSWLFGASPSARAEADHDSQLLKSLLEHHYSRNYHR